MKWKVAWDGLVDKGWVMYDIELGYEIPVESVIIGSIPVQIKEQKQWVSEVCILYSVLYYFVSFYFSFYFILFYCFISIFFCAILSY